MSIREELRAILLTLNTTQHPMLLKTLNNMISTDKMLMSYNKSNEEQYLAGNV